NIIAVGIQEQGAASRAIALRNELARRRLSREAAGCAQHKKKKQGKGAHYSSTLPSTLAQRVPCTTQSGEIRIRGALMVVGEPGVPIWVPAPIMISFSASNGPFTEQLDAICMVRVLTRLPWTSACSRR